MVAPPHNGRYLRYLPLHTMGIFTRVPIRARHGILAGLPVAGFKHA